MAMMMGSVYDALVKAGAGEDNARKAAEELAGYESRFAKIESDTGILKWMVGFNIAMSVAILGKLFAGTH